MITIGSEEIMDKSDDCVVLLSTETRFDELHILEFVGLMV